MTACKSNSPVGQCSQSSTTGEFALRRWKYFCVLYATKLYYRSNLMSLIIPSKLENLIKLLKEAVTNLFLAWNGLQAETIKKRRINIFNFKENDDEDSEEYALSTLKEKYKSQKEPIEGILNLLNEMDNQVGYSKEDIHNWNNDISIEEQSDTDDDVEYCNEDIESYTEDIEVTSSEAVNAFNTVLRWGEKYIQGVPLKTLFTDILRTKKVILNL